LRFIVWPLRPGGGLGAADVEPERRWSLDVGLSGTQAGNTGSNAETFHWGPFTRFGYEFAEALRGRAALRHTENRFLYDGLGNIARQSHTALAPGINWEITESFSIDVEYTFRFGENQFRKHVGSVGLEYTIFRWMRASVDGAYNQQNYIFPEPALKVQNRTYSFGGEVAFIPHKQWEIALSVNRLSSRYTTNKSLYTAQSAGIGTTYCAKDRSYSVSAAGLVGTDSSNYTMLGGELRTRFSFGEHVSFRIGGTVSVYNCRANQQARNKRTTSSETISPLGNTDEFVVSSVSIEGTYAF